MRRTTPAVLLVTVVVCSACLLLPRTLGTQASTNPVELLGHTFTVDWADPAAVPIGDGHAEVFTGRNFFGNVPAWQTDLRSGGQVGLHDALPTLPSWTNGNLVWAPSVRKLDGRYVMYYSASRAGGANCIGMATAAAADVAFTPVEVHWCGGVDAGFLDPYVFIDPAGTPFLLLSVQVGPGGGSFIASQQLSGDGLGFRGPSRILMTFGDARSMAGDGPLGSSAFVENPAVVADPFNTYDVMASVGTWNEPGAYTGVEEACFGIAPQGSPCVPARGGRFVVDGGYRPGSLSMLHDSGPDGNYAFFGQLAGTPPDLYRNVFVVPSKAVSITP
jgi:hypothetical protein